MNKSTTQLMLGLSGVVVGIAAGYLSMGRDINPAPAPAGALSEVSMPDGTATSTTPQSDGKPPPKSSQPTIVQGTPYATYAAQAAFDSTIYTSHDYPVITGTANISVVNVAIYNSKGVGLVGSSDVRVTSGHWSYSSPVKLAPGTYTIALGGAGDVKNAKLTVK